MTPKTKHTKPEQDAFSLGIVHGSLGLDLEHNPYFHAESMRNLSEAYQQGLSWYRILSKIKKPSINAFA